MTEARNKPIKDFRDLLVWQKVHNLSIKLYKISSNFPQSELYALSSQIRRAVVSVSSNIAEGFGRSSLKEKDQFLSIAHGSLYEVESQIELAKDLAYIDINVYKETLELILEAHKLLYGLQRANKKKGDGVEV